MTLIVALTGGIGSGKTVASNHFERLGAPVIDTDIIARQIVEPGQPALTQLSDAFGKDILHSSGALNRDVLRNIAFSKPENKQLLDSITHPIIRAQTIKRIEQVNFSYCVVVIPLLTKDSTFMDLANRIIAVVADKDTKINRVMHRSQLTREETLTIMKSQISDQHRLEFADDIIHNNGTIEQVNTAVENLHALYLKQ